MLVVSDRIAELEQQIATLQRERQQQYERAEKAEKRVERLQSTLDALTRKFFGISSEKIGTSAQLSLGVFDEADSVVEPEPAPSVPVAAHTRAKTRQPRYLDPALPRQEIVIDIFEEEKQCGCGASLRQIGQEENEKLHVERPKIIVVRTVRPYYACSNCEGSGDEDRPTFRIAPPAPSVCGPPWMKRSLVYRSLWHFTMWIASLRSTKNTGAMRETRY